MADPKAENALREALSTLEDLESRWSAAREYLKIDASRARHVVLSELVADPNLWDDQDRHIEEVIALVSDYATARSAFDEAVRRRPGKLITLRQKARVIQKSR